MIHQLKAKSCSVFFIALGFLFALTNTASAQLTITGNNATICEGNSMMVSVNVSGGTPPYTYNWGPSTGLSDPAIANPIASPAVTTSYNVLVTDAGSLSNSTTVTVTVLPSPTADAGTDQSGCFGSLYTVTTPIAAGETYSWNWGDGFTNNTATASHSYSFSGTYTVTLTVTNSSGCSTTDQMIITQHDNPQIVLNAQRSCPSSCNGTIGTAITAGNIPPLSYNWSTGATTDSVFGLCVGSYTVTVTNAVGCVSSLGVSVNQAWININPSPVQTICLGDSAQIAAHVVSYNPIATYRWDNGSAPFTTTDSTVMVAPVSGTSYTITVTDNTGCTANSNTGVSVQSTDIYGHVTSSAGALVNGTNTAVLFKYVPMYTSFDSIQTVPVDGAGNFHFAAPPHHDYLVEIFADTTVNHGLVPTYYGDQYLWDSGTVLDHNCSDNDTLNITMVENGTGGGPGTISGIVIKGDGFDRAPGEPIPGIDVKLGKNPGGQLIASTVTTFPSGGYVFYNVPLNAAGEHYTIYVDIPGMLRDSTRSVTVDAGHTDFTHQDYIADSNSVYYIDLTTGIAAHKAVAGGMSVYPNPANANTTIAYTLTDNANVSLGVYNVLGVKVAELANTEQSAGTYKYAFNAKNYNLKSGIYFITLVTDGKTNIQRLVITE